MSPMATRNRSLSEGEVRAGLARTLMGGKYDTPLDTQLAEQAAKESSFVRP
jgi:hypothetical protein